MIFFRIFCNFFVIWCACRGVFKAFGIYFIDGIYGCFFALYSIGGIYIWSTWIWIYFMMFVIQEMNTIKNKITTSHWCFQSNLISVKKWFKKFFNNFFCVITNHEFYVITLWMHCTLFVSVIRRNKINYYC